MLSKPSSVPPSAVKKIEPAKVSFWARMGGRSLGISLFIHGILIAVAVIWILQSLPKPPAPEVDFLIRGKGGGGGKPHSTLVRLTNRPAIWTETSRIAAHGVSNSFTIPEPSAVPLLTSTGTMPSSLTGGLGGSGSGGGLGSGFGRGSGHGLGDSTGITMFGNPLNVRSIGMVLDVSQSMTNSLPKVIMELERVAPGSPLILYAGCGVQMGSMKAMSARKGRFYSTRDLDPQRFEQFWRRHQYLPEATSLSKTYMRGTVKTKLPLSRESIFKFLQNRPNTYYFENGVVAYSWLALTSDYLQSREGIYWFSDFQDQVDQDAAMVLVQQLRSRNQKLFMHGITKGHYYEAVRTLISEPTGGIAVETKD